MIFEFNVEIQYKSITIYDLLLYNKINDKIIYLNCIHSFSSSILICNKYYSISKFNQLLLNGKIILYVTF